MGRVDLFHSRRANYDRCEYWIRDERNASGTPSQWVLNNVPSGHFWAKPVSVKSSQMNVVNGVWALDDHRMALETDDDIDDISRGSVVRFGGELWLVESTQREIHHKESEFSRHLDYRYVLNLTRG